MPEVSHLFLSSAEERGTEDRTDLVNWESRESKKRYLKICLPNNKICNYGRTFLVRSVQ